MAKSNTFREHLQGAILGTCDLWDTWSEWWGDRTWPKKRQWQRQIQRKRQWQRQIHLESTFKERSLGLVTFDTRHLSWVMRRQDLTKKLIMTKTNTKTKTMTNTFREQIQRQWQRQWQRQIHWEHLQRAVLLTCNIWDTDYISDNCELDFLTILTFFESFQIFGEFSQFLKVFVTWDMTLATLITFLTIVNINTDNYIVTFE